MTIQSEYQFLQATRPTSYNPNLGQVQRQQQEYNPQVSSKGYDPYYQPTSDDFELAQAYIDNKNNFFIQSPRANKPQVLPGKLNEGFEVPQMNSDRELHPAVDCEFDMIA